MFSLFAWSRIHPTVVKKQSLLAGVSVIIRTSHYYLVNITFGCYKTIQPTLSFTLSAKTITVIYVLGIWAWGFINVTHASTQMSIHNTYNNMQFWDLLPNLLIIYYLININFIIFSFLVCLLRKFSAQISNGLKNFD